VNQIVNAPWFEGVIIVFILINGVILGMVNVTLPGETLWDLMHLGNHLILGFFILEALQNVLRPRSIEVDYRREGKLQTL
jgi:hypothetical protein